MRILNFGSLNIDRVYQVEHFASTGETILAKDYISYIGGKGLNQSIALARAGVKVVHAGAIGRDGKILKQALEKAGVDIAYLSEVEDASGHAIIQVSHGQNCIIVYGGANQSINPEYIDRILLNFEQHDLLLLQNEIAYVPYIMKAAARKGMKIAINASPITEDIFRYPLELADYVIVNEVEGAALAGAEKMDYERILAMLVEKYKTAVVLTAGSEGAYYKDEYSCLYCPAYKVDMIDSTGAGDTFCGYFLAGMSENMGAGKSLELASAAAAIAVTKTGASNSIPLREETELFINKKRGEGYEEKIVSNCIISHDGDHSMYRVFCENTGKSDGSIKDQSNRSTESAGDRR